MTEEKKLEPELRFPGFHEPWEEKKLGEIAGIVMGQSPNSNTYNKQKIGIPLVQGNADIKERKTDPKLYTNKPTKVIEKGNILLTVRAPVGNIAKVMDKVCIGRGVCSINTNDNFIYYYLIKNEKKWIRLSQGSTFTAINSRDINEFLVIKPKLKLEQEKIGKFFSTIDKKLDLQRERIKELKSYKKGMMQRIFDQEIRFKDENGRDYPDWEEKKLNNILNERKEMIEKGRGVPHASLTKYGLELKTERYDRDFLVRDSNKKYKITKLNDICYNPANLKFGAITINKLGDLIISPIYVTFEISDTISPDYISYYFRRWDFINMVRKYEEGTVYERQAVKPEYFLKFKIKLPSLPEQEKIANFLSAIDKRIELEEEKLELYEDFKKGLMQRMFV